MKSLEAMMTDLKVAGKSQSTCVSYVSAAKQFLAYTKVTPSKAKREHISQFMDYLANERRLAPPTVAIAACALRFYFEVTIGRPRIVEGLHAPRLTPKMATVLSVDEALRFLDSFASVKHAAIATTLYGTGLRLREALALTVKDIDAERGVITVRHTKTRHPRVARLTRMVLEHLRNYWRATRPPLPLLFPGLDPTKPVDPATVQEAFRSAATACGLNKRVTPHVLRHTYATHMLESGVDVHTVQRLLGHTAISSTLHYLHVSVQHLAGRRAELPPLLR